MLAGHPQKLLVRRRAAFTLLEVLVVVAILVILASVASIYVFKFRSDAFKDKARLDMQALTTAYNSFKLKSGEDMNFDDITVLAPYMTEGTNSLRDPWGNMYRVRPMAAEQMDRVQFYTVAPDGEEIVWPRQ